MEKYLPSFKKILDEKIFSFITMTSEQEEDFKDNQIEFFKTTDEYFHDCSVRESATTIVTALANEGLLIEDTFNLCSKIILNNSE